MADAVKTVEVLHGEDGDSGATYTVVPLHQGMTNQQVVQAAGADPRGYHCSCPYDCCGHVAVSRPFLRRGRRVAVVEVSFSRNV